MARKFRELGFPVDGMILDWTWCVSVTLLALAVIRGCTINLRVWPHA